VFDVRKNVGQRLGQRAAEHVEIKVPAFRARFAGMSKNEQPMQILYEG
jgi:hypothetical protein